MFWIVIEKLAELEHEFGTEEFVEWGIWEVELEKGEEGAAIVYGLGLQRGRLGERKEAEGMVRQKSLNTSDRYHVRIYRNFVKEKCKERK